MVSLQPGKLPPAGVVVIGTLEFARLVVLERGEDCGAVAGVPGRLLVGLQGGQCNGSFHQTSPISPLCWLYDFISSAMPAFCGLAVLTDAAAAAPLITVGATPMTATVSAAAKIRNGDRRPDRTL